MVRRQPQAVALVVGGIVSVQCGAALATQIFDRAGPAGTVFVRTAFAAALLALVVRGRGMLGDRRLLRDTLVFGFVLAAMNLAFYESIDRLPLGTAVTLEFVGPLGVAIAGTRRPRDLIWAGLAAGGVVILAGGIEGGSGALGIVLALTAGAFWGAYIVLNARLGGRHEGLEPLALSLALSALMLAPAGIAVAGDELLSPTVLAIGLAVGLLSSAIPYGLELEALRRLPGAVFGVLMSIEPAVATAIGFVALSQGLSASDVVAIAMVVVASAGALRSAGFTRPLDD